MLFESKHVFCAEVRLGAVCVPNRDGVQLLTRSYEMRFCEGLQSLILHKSRYLSKHQRPPLILSRVWQWLQLIKLSRFSCYLVKPNQNQNVHFAFHKRIQQMQFVTRVFGRSKGWLTGNETNCFFCLFFFFKKKVRID